MIEALVLFGRELATSAVPASPDRVQAMASALGHLDAAKRADLYWAGRLTCCSDPADIERYDAVFARVFDAAPIRPPVLAQRTSYARPLRENRMVVAGDGEGEDETEALTVGASRDEVLRHRDVAALTEDERAEVRRLLARIAPRLGHRRSHRFAAARHGRPDLHRTVRRMMHSGGEPAMLAREAPRAKPRRLVLLVDVSGSMAPYADGLLRFAHAAVRAAPLQTEVFTLGTRLTRVTRELRRRDADQALAAAGRAIPDWSGGTRLGDNLRAFLDRWGQRGVARGATVAICSDGWERGEPAELAEQARRLRRLAHSVIWVNPHRGKAGFAPLTGGMQAVLPHVDALVAGHSVAALEDLVEVIAHA